MSSPVVGLNDPTVAGLLELANRGLAGLLSDGPSLSEIHQAVEAINAGFDGCSTLVTCGTPTDASPPNDRFLDRTLLHGSVSAAVRNVAATAEPGEPSHVSSGGGKSVWWQWMPTQSGLVRIRTQGSSFDTALAVYAGNSVDQLTLLAASDDHAGEVWSEVIFEATAGVACQIAVDGYLGACGTVVVTIDQASAP
jgi:hypothetical protein